LDYVFKVKRSDLGSLPVALGHRIYGDGGGWKHG